MGSISKITINYDKVRKTINEHYADLGRDVKVRIVHKQSPRGRNFYVFDGCEKTVNVSLTCIGILEMSIHEFNQIMRKTYEDGTKKIISIVDNAIIPPNCPKAFRDELDKEYITNKSFTITLEEKQNVR